MSQTRFPSPKTSRLLSQREDAHGSTVQSQSATMRATRVAPRNVIPGKDKRDQIIREREEEQRRVAEENQRREDLWKREASMEARETFRRVKEHNATIAGKVARLDDAKRAREVAREREDPNTVSLDAMMDREEERRDREDRETAFLELEAFERARESHRARAAGKL